MYGLPYVADIDRPIFCSIATVDCKRVTYLVITCGTTHTELVNVNNNKQRSFVNEYCVKCGELYELYVIVCFMYASVSDHHRWLTVRTL